MPRNNNEKKVQTDAMKTKAAKHHLLDLLEKAMGLVSLACNNAGITRTTHYKWMKSDPEYRKEVEGIPSRVQDFIEHALFKKIISGDTQAIIFANKSKNRDRGYYDTKHVISDIRVQEDSAENMNKIYQIVHPKKRK